MCFSFVHMMLLVFTELFFFFFLMIRRPPRSTRTDTLFPYTTLFRSLEANKSLMAVYVMKDQLKALWNAPTAWAWRSAWTRSEEHTSELQSLMRISYAVFCLKKKHTKKQQITQRKYITRTSNNNNKSIT